MSAAILSSSVACAVANLRGKKDDNYNYMIGGLSTSAVWTATCKDIDDFSHILMNFLLSLVKNSLKGVGMGVVFAIGGICIKETMKNDWTIWTDHIESDRDIGGSSGFRDWGDIRIPGGKFTDPGRRPGF